jgi:hypothetical protein
MMNLHSLTKTLQNTQIGFKRIDRFLAFIINGNKLIFNEKTQDDSGDLGVETSYFQ